MAVYFVYRSPYESPSAKRLASFPDETVLDWFRRHWNLVAEGGSTAELLGFPVSGFESLFAAVAEHGLPRPRTAAALAKALREHLYSEGAIFTGPHLITVQTDDDEL